MGLEEWRGGEHLGGDEEGETMISIYCMKKIFVFNLKECPGPKTKLNTCPMT